MTSQQFSSAFFSFSFFASATMSSASSRIFVACARVQSFALKAAAVVWTLLLAVIFASMILYAIVLAYVFPLLSIASNTTLNMFKNAFLIGTHYLFVTILFFFVHYVMFFLVVNVFTPLIIFGEGLCAVICAQFLLKILRPLLYDPNAPKENADLDESDGEAGL